MPQPLSSGATASPRAGRRIAPGSQGSTSGSSSGELRLVLKRSERPSLPESQDDKPKVRRNSDSEVADMLVAAAAASPELAAMSPEATPVPGPSRSRSRSRPRSPEQSRHGHAVGEGPSAPRQRVRKPKQANSDDESYCDANSGIEDGAIDVDDAEEYKPRIGSRVQLSKRNGKRRATDDDESDEEPQKARRASAPQLPPASILRHNRRASMPGFRSAPGTPATPGFELPDGIASARWSSARSRMVVIIPPRSERQQPKLRKKPPIYYSYTRSPPRSRKLSFGAPAPSPASVFANDRAAKLHPGEPTFAPPSPQPSQGESAPRVIQYVGLLPPIASDDGRRALGSPPATLDSVLDYAASPEAIVETPPSDREVSTPGTSLSSTPTTAEMEKGEDEAFEEEADAEMDVDEEVELDRYVELGPGTGIKVIETTTTATTLEVNIVQDDAAAQPTDETMATDHASPSEEIVLRPPVEVW